MVALAAWEFGFAKDCEYHTHLSYFFPQLASSLQLFTIFGSVYFRTTKMGYPLFSDLELISANPFSIAGVSLLQPGNT